MLVKTPIWENKILFPSAAKGSSGKVSNHSVPSWHTQSECRCDNNNLHRFFVTFFVSC